MRSVSDLESPWDRAIMRPRRWFMRLREWGMHLHLTQGTFGLTAITTPMACGLAAFGAPASAMAAMAVTMDAGSSVDVDLWVDAASKADAVSLGAADLRADADAANIGILSIRPPSNIYRMAFPLSMYLQ